MDEEAKKQMEVFGGGFPTKIPTPDSTNQKVWKEEETFRGPCVTSLLQVLMPAKNVQRRSMHHIDKTHLASDVEGAYRKCVHEAIYAVVAPTGR